METVYDWATVAIFCGLIMLFLDRSSQEEPGDHLWQYLVAAVGCGVANYFGNEGIETGNSMMHFAAIATIAAVLTFTIMVLKPFDRFRKGK